jgi:hypothetical protein
MDTRSEPSEDRRLARPTAAAPAARGRCRRVAALLCALAALACAQEEPPGPEWLARGAAAVLPFKKRLQQELSKALAQGPEHAIDVCRVRAPELAREAGSDLLEIGRTSHRLRNPANAPREWMKPLLAEAVAEGIGADARVVRLDSGRIGYVEPIFVLPPCLACHGEPIAPPVAARLRELYPDDRATGFRVGELRGLFWAELSGDGAKPSR